MINKRSVINFPAFITWMSVVFLLSTHLSAQLLSFPGAEGAGKFVSGGRGNVNAAPKIYEVTSLVDNSTAGNTPGTLRYAVTNNSPSVPNRIVVFRVSGVIHLYTTLNLTRANTTIAGQTAPGGGITIADYPVYISNSNIVIRYVRFRLGDKNQPASLGNDDAFGDNGNPRLKIMIDHCSMSWSNDEVTSIYDGDSMTIQWCMMTEPLDSSYHDEGSGVQQHAYGGIQGGRHASLHHNLYAHCRGRMPRFNGIRTGYADTTDFRNNVLYNWADYNVNGGEGGSYNVVNNYYKYGPNTPSSATSGVNRRNMLIQPYKQGSPAIGFGKYYLTGNYCFNSSSVTNRNWLGASFSGGSYADSVNSKVNVPFNCVNINQQSALDAYQSVLSKAGCILPYRDTLDQRIISNVINGTGRLINCQGGYPRGTPYSISQAAWPFLPTGYTPADNDHDGMPDLWESQRGLNPALSTDLNQYLSTTGYNNIETYLNGDTITAPGILNTCIDGRVVSANNSGSWLHLKDSSWGDYNSPRYLVSTDTNNLIVSFYDNANLGSLYASYFTTGTIRTDAMGKSYLNRNITLNSSVAPTAPVTVRLYISKKEYDDLRAADNTITALSDLRIVRSSNSSCGATLPSDYAVYLPTASGIFGSYRNGYYLDFETEALGTFYITGFNTVLPVRILNFEAHADDEIVNVNWTVEQELGVANYEVQKSADALNFTSIGKLSASNASGSMSYHFTDNNPIIGRSFYRLKINDLDGRLSYSKIYPVQFSKKQAITVFPNPVTNQFQVTHPVASNQSVLKLIDMNGKMIRIWDVAPGSRSTVLKIGNIASGIYWLEYQNEGVVNRIKITKL